jgi:hypothetical protein
MTEEQRYRETKALAQERNKQLKRIADALDNISCIIKLFDNASSKNDNLCNDTDPIRRIIF